MAKRSISRVRGNSEEQNQATTKSKENIHPKGVGVTNKKRTIDFDEEESDYSPQKKSKAIIVASKKTKNPTKGGLTKEIEELELDLEVETNNRRRKTTKSTIIDSKEEIETAKSRGNVQTTIKTKQDVIKKREGKEVVPKSTTAIEEKEHRSSDAEVRKARKEEEKQKKEGKVEEEEKRKQTKAKEEEEEGVRVLKKKLEDMEKKYAALKELRYTKAEQSYKELERDLRKERETSQALIQTLQKRKADLEELCGVQKQQLALSEKNSDKLKELIRTDALYRRLTGVQATPSASYENQFLCITTSSNASLSFNLLIDDTPGEVEYTPMRLEYDGAELPEYLRESIVFSSHNTPVFLSKLIAAIHA